MTKKVRFIHVADIHLGSPVRGLRGAGDEWAAALQEAVVSAWERVVSAALSHDVDFVIVAGDMFDTSKCSYGDYLRFFEGLERLDAAGIPSYLVTGNHDPFTTWERDMSRLPALATMLGVDGPEFALFARDGEPLCLIGGRSYRNQAWPEGESISAGVSRAAAVEALRQRASRRVSRVVHADKMPAAAPSDESRPAPNGDPQGEVLANAAEAPFMIGVVHAGLVPDQSKARANLDDLLATDVDYWACGHLHEPHVYPNNANPRVVYPGCVQGTKMDEAGERGCFLVELEEPPAGSSRKAHVRIQFIPTSSVILQQIDVDVSACQTLADVRRHVQSEQFHENGKAHCDEMVSRVTLKGQTTLHGFLSKREIRENLREQLNNSYPNFYCDALIDRTSLPGDVAWPGGDDDFFPEVVKSMADEQRTHGDVLINFVQSEFVKRGISVPGSLSEFVGDFNDAAEKLVFDLLRDDAE